ARITCGCQTNRGKHASPIRVPKNAVSFPIRVTNHTVHYLSLTRGYKPPFPVPQTQSAFHPTAQRNASRRRDVRRQSRSFACWNQPLTHSPNSPRPPEIVSNDSQVFHLDCSRIVAVIEDDYGR